MTRELSKNLMCILVRGGIEIWLEEEKVKDFQKILRTSSESRFVELNGETINTADITGIFKATTMEDLTRRKNGMWKCKYGYWHEKGEQCAHGDLEKYRTY